MSKFHHHQSEPNINKVPRWKWLLIILMIVAMPLFFSFIHSIQIQQALMNTTPANQPQNTSKQVEQQP